MECPFCDSSDGDQLSDSEVCDTRGGNYTSKTAYKCCKCKKYYYVFDGNDELSCNWDRAIPKDEIKILKKRLK